MAPTTEERFIREREVRRLVGNVARDTIWRWEHDPEVSFPRRRRISANVTVWLESEIRAWMAQRAGHAEAA